MGANDPRHRETRALVAANEQAAVVRAGWHSRAVTWRRMVAFVGHGKLG